jgi:hypothetical protein
MKKSRIFFALLFLAFIGIQFVEVEQTNPPVYGEIRTPIDVKTILKKSCYDCHSNSTVWPWYAKVAPVSWIISDDVKEGRKALNFSEWEKLKYSVKEEMIKKIWKVVNNDKMPLVIYTIMHTDAKLDVLRKNIIKKWVSSYIDL